MKLIEDEINEIKMWREMTIYLEETVRKLLMQVKGHVQLTLLDTESL